MLAARQREEPYKSVGKTGQAITHGPGGPRRFYTTAKVSKRRATAWPRGKERRSPTSRYRYLRPRQAVPEGGRKYPAGGIACGGTPAGRPWAESAAGRREGSRVSRRGRGPDDRTPPSHRPSTLFAFESRASTGHMLPGHEQPAGPLAVFPVKDPEIAFAPSPVGGRTSRG